MKAELRLNTGFAMLGFLQNRDDFCLQVYVVPPTKTQTKPLRAFETITALPARAASQGPGEGVQARAVRNWISDSKNLRPSSEAPVNVSTLCSGWGIRPTTLPCSLVIPAMSLADPLGLSR